MGLCLDRRKIWLRGWVFAWVLGVRQGGLWGKQQAVLLGRCALGTYYARLVVMK